MIPYITLARRIDSVGLFSPDQKVESKDSPNIQPPMILCFFGLTSLQFSILSTYHLSGYMSVCQHRCVHSVSLFRSVFFFSLCLCLQVSLVVLVVVVLVVLCIDLIWDCESRTFELFGPKGKYCLQFQGAYKKIFISNYLMRLQRCPRDA